jgi:ribose-phosphate pyrophosphokinase
VNADASAGRPERSVGLYAGSSHPALAAAVARELGHPVDRAVLARGGNGEVYARYEQSVRGADVFLLQSCAPPTNDHLMELLVLTQAARLASARTVTAVLSWYPYARQDKRDLEGEPLSARLVADLLAAAGLDRTIVVDLHTDQIQGFARFPFDHVSAVPLLAERVLAAIGEDARDLVVVSADAGRVHTARVLARLLGGSTATIVKTRPAQQTARVTDLIGDVGGRTCVLVDDMIDTGGTLCSAGEALRDRGALRIWACATHAVLSPPACERLAASVFERIVVTDTLPVDLARTPRTLEVASVAPLLAAAIRAVLREESVSALAADGPNPRGAAGR